MRKIEPFPGKLSLCVKPREYTTRSGKTAVTRNMGYVLTPEQEAWMRKWFPKVENSRIIDATGMAFSTLHRFARELGLTKSKNGIAGIRKRHAAHVKRLCEKNGYYESLRGKKPSEACLIATAKMWQEVREGKRDHPLCSMKRTNPRKYRKWQQHKSEARRLLIQREKLRVIYGLSRKTNLRVVICPFTSSQRNFRYNALKRGYFLSTDISEEGGERYNIYYDNDTKRSEKFEQNCIKGGFRIIQEL